jgi:hypothetical protein
LACLWIVTAIVVVIASWIHNRQARGERGDLRRHSQQQKALSEEYGVYADRQP